MAPTRMDATRAVEAALAQLTPALKARRRHHLSGAAPARQLRGKGAWQPGTVAGDRRQLLILAVLYLFLRDWRSALITFLAIPLSLLAAVTVLDRMGQTLNTMTLGRLRGGAGRAGGRRHHRHREYPATPGRECRKPDAPRSTAGRSSRDATLEVRGPVVYATLVVIAVFLPALFSTSVQGHFVGPWRWPSCWRCWPRWRWR